MSRTRYKFDSERDKSTEEEDDVSDEEVFALNSSNGSSSEDDNDDSDVENDFLQKLPNHLQKIVRKAAAGRSDSSDEGEAKDLREVDRVNDFDWGKKKSSYYNADTADLEIGQDFNEAIEEEEAALELQRASYSRLKSDDYETDSTTSSQTDKESGLTRNSKGPAYYRSIQTNQLVEEVISVSKKVDSLGIKEKLSMVLNHSPELPGLLSDIRALIEELINVVDPLCKNITPELGGSTDGMKYLKVKRQLLLSLIVNQSFYMCLKAEGYPNANKHPVVKRILRLKEFSDSLKPVDDQLKPQIKLLVEALNHGIDLAKESKDYDSESSNESMNFENQGATTKNENPKLTEPTRLNTPHVNGSKFNKEEKRFMNGKNSRDFKKEGKKYKSSNYNAHVANFGEIEEDVTSKSVTHSLNVLVNRIQQKDELKLKRKHEEDVGDLNVSGISKIDLHGQQKNGSPDQRDDSRADDYFASRTNKREESCSNKTKIKKAVERTVIPSKNESNRNVPKQRNAFLEAAIQQKNEAVQQKKRAKKVERRPVGSFEAELEKERMKYAANANQEVRRGASYQIIKNKGLVPIRNKLLKNPRVKKRVAFRKAEIRRKGQVREVRASEAVGYGGEPTGIRNSVVRSRKLTM